jgi:glycosyltransferase involved in cell wall biosynthesis
MSEQLPRVSVVVEASVNDREEFNVSVFDTLASLTNQDYPRDRVELLVSQSGWTEDKKQLVLKHFPCVKVVDSSHGYFKAKNAGIRAARGSIIALADADCIYPRDWISTVVRRIEDGHDVAAGVTYFTGHSLIERLCAFYDFHSSLIHTRTRPPRFNSNNVAFRSSVIKSTLYDERHERSGACVDLADRLMKEKRRFSFSERQVVHHHFQGVRTHLFLRMLRNGRDLIRTRQLNPQMTLASVVRLRWLAPPLLALIMFASDVYNLAQNRKIIRARWLELPIFLLFSTIVRTGEIVGMYWSLAHPQSIDRHVRA